MKKLVLKVSLILFPGMIFAMQGPEIKNDHVHIRIEAKKYDYFVEPECGILGDYYESTAYCCYDKQTGKYLGYLKKIDDTRKTEKAIVNKLKQKNMRWCCCIPYYVEPIEPQKRPLTPPATCQGDHGSSDSMF